MTPPRARAAVLAFVLLFPPALAGAQPIDPIGDLLKSAPPAPSQPSDEDEEAGGVDLDLPDAAPNTPSRPGPVSVPGQRVLVDDHKRTPEPPLTSAERGYESRIRAGFSAAENRQGSLEGRWLVRSQAGALYAFQLIDSGSGTLDGAWRNSPTPPGCGAPPAACGTCRPVVGGPVRGWGRGVRAHAARLNRAQPGPRPGPCPGKGG